MVSLRGALILSSCVWTSESTNESTYKSAVPQSPVGTFPGAKVV